MRLQIRVTPAHQELLDHLEAVDKEYRGKRLIALAAMMLAQMRQPASQVQTVAPSSETVALGIPEVADSVDREVKSRKAPGWITSANS